MTTSGSPPATAEKIPGQAASPRGSAAIPSVDWWITSRCTLSCDFCYGPVPARDPVHLRGRIADAISAAPTDAVTFCGGEPLLVKRLPEYARRQQEAGKITILNTNGELLLRRFGSGTRLPFDVIGISVDGATEAVHRAMRGPAARHTETLAAARWVAQRRDRVRLKLATVLGAVNAAYIGELARLVRGIAPDVWRIYQYSPWGPQNHGGARHRLAAAEFQAAVERATGEAAPVPVRASAVATTAGCLIVDPYGTVLRSEDTGYAALGNCLEEPIVDIWNRAPHRGVVRENKRWLNLVHPVALGEDT